jgi:hypothetical protein
LGLNDAALRLDRLVDVFQGRWPWLDYKRTFGALTMPGFYEVIIERYFLSAHPPSRVVQVQVA